MLIRIRCHGKPPDEPQVIEVAWIIAGCPCTATASYAVRNRNSACYAGQHNPILKYAG